MKRRQYILWTQQPSEYMIGLGNPHTAPFWHHYTRKRHWLDRRKRDRRGHFRSLYRPEHLSAIGWSFHSQSKYFIPLSTSNCFGCRLKLVGCSFFLIWVQMHRFWESCIPLHSLSPVICYLASSWEGCTCVQLNCKILRHSIFINKNRNHCAWRRAV